MSQVKVSVKKIIRKEIFFPNKLIPKCDKRLLLTPIVSIVLGATIIMIISVLIHILIYYFWERNYYDMVVSTQCAKYLGNFQDDIYQFEYIPYSVSPIFISFGVRDLLQMITDGFSLRWKQSHRISNLEGCASSNIKKCKFENSLWWCENKKKTLPCRTFQIKDKMKSKFQNQESEDCLYVSIKVPKSKPKKAPVIVFLHGTNYASYIKDDTSETNPFEPSGKFINEIDSIFVTVQFRMGILGTFYNHENKLTNFAISDILSSFKWIENNIDKFGGDTSNIVLFGHGTGATLALNTFVKNVQIFSGMWLSSGSIHIPREEENILQVYRKLVSKVDSRCDSRVYFTKFCRHYYQNLLNFTVDQIVEISSEFYDNAKTLNNLLNIDFILQQNTIQPKLIVIDNRFIIDSPINMIYGNSFKPIPIVFTSVNGELDGFPGARELNLLTKEQIKRSLIKVLSLIFTKSGFNDTSLASKIFEVLLIRSKEKRMTNSELMVEVLSLLRVTCPYKWLADKLTKFNDNKPIFNFIHTNRPSVPVNKFIFNGNVKSLAFYGYDVLILFKRSNLFIKDLSRSDKNYENKYFDAFRKFVHEKTFTDISGIESGKIISLDSSGFSIESRISELCRHLDYAVLASYLAKIN